MSKVPVGITSGGTARAALAAVVALVTHWLDAAAALAEPVLDEVAPPVPEDVLLLHAAAPSANASTPARHIDLA
jgi:hypothetical protein